MKGTLLNANVRIQANRPLTEKQWQKIHATLADAFEQAIAESPRLTEQIGSVYMPSPWGMEFDKEIQP